MEVIESRSKVSPCRTFIMRRIIAKGEKQALHLYTDDNEQKDGPMSIQFLCWWDDLETKFKDLKKKKKAEKLQK